MYVDQILFPTKEYKIGFLIFSLTLIFIFYFTFEIKSIVTLTKLKIQSNDTFLMNTSPLVIKKIPIACIYFNKLHYSN